MEDSQIIASLLLRDEAALDEMAAKYRRLYCNVLREILNDPQDIEECANDVLLAVWNSIPPHQPHNLPAYICKIARRIGIDRLRYRTRQKRSGYETTLSELENCLPDHSSLLDGDSLHIRAVLSHFARELDPVTQVLFIRRYVYLESVESLAKRYRFSENSVAVRLYRARKKLKKVLEKEDIFL